MSKDRKEISELVDAITDYFDENKNEIYFKERERQATRELKRIEKSISSFKEENLNGSVHY